MSKIRVFRTFNYSWSLSYWLYKHIYCFAVNRFFHSSHTFLFELFKRFFLFSGASFKAWSTTAPASLQRSCWRAKASAWTRPCSASSEMSTWTRRSRQTPGRIGSRIQSTQILQGSTMFFIQLFSNHCSLGRFVNRLGILRQGFTMSTNLLTNWQWNNFIGGLPCCKT